MRNSLFRSFWQAAALCAVCTACTLAQAAPEQLNPITWQVKAEAPRGVKPGETFKLLLTANIQEGWHLYSTEQQEGGPRPTRIALSADQPFELAGAISAPDPFVSMDENFGIETEYYEQSVTFTLPVRVTAKASAGAQKIGVNIRYQTCTKELCLPPKLVKLEAAVTIN